MSDLYYLRRRKHNSRYYNLVLGLWKEYMPSRTTSMNYEMFARLMSQRPSEVESIEEIWNDLIERGNLVI